MTGAAVEVLRQSGAEDSHASELRLRSLSLGLRAGSPPLAGMEAAPPEALQTAAWPAAPAEHVVQAVDVIERALALYPNGELALSFNGGKDCTILLGLVQLAEARRRKKLEAEGGALSAAETSALFTGAVKMVYFVQEGCFAEQDEFIARAQRLYGFELLRVGADMQESTALLVREHGVRAFLMGTRRADPYGAALDAFSPSTPGWAPFMRVNPVLDWEYATVWRFIRDYGVPYCPLYDQGYSSIGLQKDTERNPHLSRADGSYRPPWELDVADSERGGRGSGQTEGAAPDREGASAARALREAVREELRAEVREEVRAELRAEAAADAAVGAETQRI